VACNGQFHHDGDSDVPTLLHTWNIGQKTGFSKSNRIGGHQFALRLNGEILWETCTGSGEIDNDKFSELSFTGPKAVTIDAIVPVNAGEFVLEIVGRPTNLEYYCGGYVPHGELTAFEFRR
jgi:hypothetical protein